jgi:endonuclease-3
VKETCRQIIERFGGRVPATMEELLTLPGVGRKTANLVLILSHASRDNICVDTHVHRISNRLGWVRTKMPDQTEQALYRAVPRRYWPKSICTW